VEFHGPINRNALRFLSELGSWRLVEMTGDIRAFSFLFQRISVATAQRFNSVLLHDCFLLMTTDQSSLQFLFFVFKKYLFTIRDFPVVKTKNVNKEVCSSWDFVVQEHLSSVAPPLQPKAVKTGSNIVSYEFLRICRTCDYLLGCLLLHAVQ